MPAGGIELIQGFEGIPDGDPSTVDLDGYLDPLDIRTIGEGHAVRYQAKHPKGAANKANARRFHPGEAPRRTPGRC